MSRYSSLSLRAGDLVKIEIEIGPGQTRLKCPFCQCFISKQNTSCKCGFEFKHRMLGSDTFGSGEVEIVKEGKSR